MEKVLINTNLEAEQALLGRIIMNNEIIVQFSVGEEDFVWLSHKKIISHILEKKNNNLPTDQISLSNFFQSLPEGKKYITTLLLAANNSSIIAPSEILKTIRELRIKRELENIALELKNLATDPSMNSQEIKEIILNKVEQLKALNPQRETLSLGDCVKNCFNKAKGEVALIYTGYKELDDITGGFELGDFVVLAGRPSMGKSAIGINIALMLAKKGIPSLIISLEMNQDQVSRRITANLASLRVSALKHNILNSQEEFQSFQRAVQESDKLPIYLNDEGSITLPKIKYEITKFLKKGIKFVMIDYIQIVQHKIKGSTTEKITEITNSLKAMAMELGVVIMGLSQLNRAVELRDDKRPNLSDLKDSSSIEADANAVIFAFRPEYYLKNQKPDENKPDYAAKLRQWETEMQRLRGVTYALVEKNRDGKCGEAKLRFEGEFMRITNF